MGILSNHSRTDGAAGKEHLRKKSDIIAKPAPKALRSSDIKGT
jgi:hypothetical protein